ncbi:hypothetical protein E8E15_010887 [Penicillium rubens]|uniref:uncharacterized protein n=1 Tax=Penicillium rubens TaxID=1108849 RepID=UPI001D1CCD3E|nr:uncharacterized protein N7525_001658 [Penicillium rubens]KAF3029087.1 hypothetical protein E8E15_010887 [Penicillium rubens]KAJ5843917.1 hypothetical protein N7525_001658 [Penicillium rubens]KAJ5845495.1 hypothetical protein N7534_009164 [Penicillium rubens]
MSMIPRALEAATCAAVWVVLILVSAATFCLMVQWLETRPVATWRRYTLSQAKKKWMDDKKRLLAESKAILDREVSLIKDLQRGEDEMAKRVIDAAGLESMAVLERPLDEIRRNWRELSDLLDRYCH